MIALNRTILRNNSMIVVVVVIGYLITIHFGIPTYIDIFSVNTVLGITAIIFTWQGAGKRKQHFGWLIAVGVLLLLYTRVPSKFIIYIVIGMTGFSLMENVAGRAGQLAILSLILMSPLYEYFTNVFGFPIRLQLTRIAGEILHRVDHGYKIDGNVLMMGTTEFSVDTACMGLHMLISSMLTGMILLGIYQRRMGKKLSSPSLFAIGIAVFMLNLFSNLIRIISLVEFRIPPENSFHAVIGLACFLIYVLLPSVLLIKFMVKRFGLNHRWQTANSIFTRKSITIHIFLLLLIAGIAIASKERSMNEYLQTGTIKAPGYRIENLQDQIVKLSTDKVLIYLKPIIGFYSSDHQPTMCWKGSGYEFRNMKTIDLDGQFIYTSCLEKGNEKLYTAWWYDNGKFQTISQLDWRWDSFRNNSPWVLVDVTSNSKSELINQIRQIRRLNPCRMLLKAE